MKLMMMMIRMSDDSYERCDIDNMNYILEGESFVYDNGNNDGADDDGDDDDDDDDYDDDDDEMMMIFQVLLYKWSLGPAWLHDSENSSEVSLWVSVGPAGWLLLKALSALQYQHHEAGAGEHDGPDGAVRQRNGSFSNADIICNLI